MLNKTKIINNIKLYKFYSDNLTVGECLDISKQMVIDNLEREYMSERLIELYEELGEHSSDILIIEKDILSYSKLDKKLRDVCEYLSQLKYNEKIQIEIGFSEALDSLIERVKNTFLKRL
jgi:hypothetical protein